MFKRALFRGMFVLSATAAISATVVAASSLTERLEGHVSTGRFLCVEHRHWTPVMKSDLRGLQRGDIVRVDAHRGGLDRLVLLRTAAEELGSPEQ